MPASIYTMSDLEPVRSTLPELEGHDRAFDGKRRTCRKQGGQGRRGTTQATGVDIHCSQRRDADEHDRRDSEHAMVASPVSNRSCDSRDTMTSDKNA